MLLTAFAATPVLAVQTAFDRDGVLDVRLSPDGEHVTVLMRQSDTDTLYVVNTSKRKNVATVTRNAPERIFSARWLDGKEILLEGARELRHQILPGRTGQLERLSLKGKLQALSLDGPVTVVDSLPSLAESALVANHPGQQLWLLKARSGKKQAVAYPPLDSPEIIASPNADFLVAVGTNNSGGHGVVLLNRTAGSEWLDIDPELWPVSVNNLGTVFAMRPDPNGVKGLVAFDPVSRTTSVLFQDPGHDAERVFFDHHVVPYAIRFQPDYPSWAYLKGSKLVGVHKSLRAALPDADLAFSSLTQNADQIVVQATYDNRPEEYLLVDTRSGIKAQRLLIAPTSLFSMGGETRTAYHTQPFVTKSRTGEPLYGMASLPKKASLNPRPTVVLLRDDPTDSRWVWRYDPQVAYLNQQGFNVLRVNHRGSPGYGTAHATASLKTMSQDVEDAILWAVKDEMAMQGRICLLGRGEGAEIAILTALASNALNCVISHGGQYSGMGFGDRANASDLQVLLIYGADDPDYRQRQEQLGRMLADLNITHQSLVLDNEVQRIGKQRNEVQALARVSSFLNAQIGTARITPALPLILEQSTMLDGLVIKAMERSADRSKSQEVRRVIERSSVAAKAAPPKFDLRARQWLRGQDANVRKHLSEDQWRIYDSFFDNEFVPGKPTPFLKEVASNRAGDR
jgi:hypothetical protein